MPIIVVLKPLSYKLATNPSKSDFFDKIVLINLEKAKNKWRLAPSATFTFFTGR